MDARFDEIKQLKEHMNSLLAGLQRDNRDNSKVYDPLDKAMEILTNEFTDAIKEAKQGVSNG